MNFFRQIIVVMPFFLWLTTLVAQVPGEAAILAELEKRGYDAQRVRQEFLTRGFDDASFQSKDPAVISQLKEAAKEIVNVLEEEKKTSSNLKEKGPGTSSVNEDQNTGPVPVDKNPNKSGHLQVSTSSEQLQKIEQPAQKKKQPTYGQQIFQDKTLELFRSVADSKPGGQYILGAGDQVTISIWGPTQENFTLHIQKEGFIQPTGLQRFYLAGMSLSAARELMFTGLKSKYYFSKENFEMTVTAARTVNVNIVGEVFQNGTYNLSAVNTAFNALVAAGGPTDIGSVRKIQLLRAGKKPLVLDVYRFLQNPMLGNDFQLQENDYIHVPVAEKIISIQGAVNRPSQYELLAGEHLFELLGFAGGLTSGAKKKNIRIKRMEGDTARIIDIDYAQLEKGNKNYTLVHGDVIEINEIDDLVKNQVSVSGGVITPGVYALIPGMRVSDVISKAELQAEAITEFAYLFRKGSVNAQIKDYIQVNLKQSLKLPGSDWDLELRSGDSLAVYVRDQFSDASVIKIEGAVRNPGQFKYSPTLTLKDVLLLAGGAKREAALDRIDVYRLQWEVNKSTRVLAARVSVDEKYNLTGSSGSYQLQPFDQVFVRYAPEFELQRNVTINGEVIFPGMYALLNENMRLDALVREAGGVTNEAFLKGATLARGQDNIGYVIIDLEAALAMPASHENLILQDGDVINIPKLSNIVTITGATKSQELYPEKITSQNKIQVTYRKGKNARYYINQFAGGLSKEAAINRIAVIDASGKVTKVRNYLLFRKYPEVGPGAEIRVGYKEKKAKGDDGKEKKEIKWGEILSNAITQATAVLSLILLIQNVK